MRFRGGHNILLQGRPDGMIKLMPEPEVLYLPLRSRRFSFDEVCVEEGQQVNGGDVLAFNAILQCRDVTNLTWSYLLAFGA